MWRNSWVVVRWCFLNTKLMMALAFVKILQGMQLIWCTLKALTRVNIRANDPTKLYSPLDFFCLFFLLDIYLTFDWMSSLSENKMRNFVEKNPLMLSTESCFNILQCQSTKIFCCCNERGRCTFSSCGGSVKLDLKFFSCWGQTKLNMSKFISSPCTLKKLKIKTSL